MKKILAILLAAMLMFGAVACNTNDTVDTDANDTVASDTESDTEAPTSNVIEPTVEDNTMGKNIWNLFLTTLAENEGKTPEELANLMCANLEVIPYGCMGMTIEAGLMTGFNNYEVTGFESGAVFMPMMGTIPFVGYVFTLAEGADVSAFIKNLNDNCNMRWNICTSAEQVVAGANGNTVLFVMCPSAVDGGFGE